MPIDPTTLHGRTLGSLTVEDLEACPDGAVLVLPEQDHKWVRVKGWWQDGNGLRSSRHLKECAAAERVLMLPAVAPAPTDPKPPVYAIGRFVVMRNADGDTFALDASDIREVSAWKVAGESGYDVEWDKNNERYTRMLHPSVDLDTLLHAIAKAEGR